MAATVSNLGRGNYVLGGLGAVRGPSAADAMVENQQEARAAREAELLAQQRRQQMQLAQSEESRAQATFAQQQEAYRRQQAAAAEARNREAQRRALMDQYRAPGVGEAPVIFQPQAAPVVQPVNTTGYPVGVPVTRTGATRGRYRPDEGPASPVLTYHLGADAQLVTPEATSGLTLTLPATPATPVTPATPAAPAAQPAGLTIPPPAGAGARTYIDFVAAARTGQPLSEQEFIRSVEAGMLTPQQAADVQAMLDGYVPSEQEVRAATAPGRGPMPDTGYIPPAGYQALENFIQGVTGETLAEKQAREAEYAARAGEDYTQRVPTTTPDGRRTTVEVDEGPVLTFGGGLRTAESDSPIDFILGQPVGSGAVAPIPRELPRLNAAIQQGVTERQRLVDAYNAFYQAGFTEDANAYLTAIQNLDQTLIRLQGEQALNDLSIGFPERASMVLSYYLGANVTLAPRAEGVYDLQVNGQDVADPELRGMTPQDAADLVRRYYDSGYQESMQEIRNTYLTEKAKRQAEQDVKDEAARQELEGLGYEVVGKETIEGLGDGWRSRDPRTGKEYFAYVVDIGEDGIPQTRVIEVPTGAKIGG
jgi:hypothetical protein